MTVVAWDGVTLAADRASEFSGFIFEMGMKIRRTSDGRLLGAAGYAGSCKQAMDWLENPKTTRGNPPTCQEQEDTSAQVIEVGLDASVTIHAHTGDVVVKSVPFAIGSGCQFALGAMLAGAAAREAVVIASLLSPNCGKGVDTLTLTQAKPQERLDEVFNRALRSASADRP